LIAAMARVPGSVATLDLAGYGADEAALRAAAAGLDHVTIHGRVDPVAFISEMDAIAIPSRWEAGAVTCWEARAAGRPTIVADIDGLPEQVPSEIGLVVRPDDVSGLAAAIVSLAGAHRPRMARRARESTEGAFGTVVAGWHAVLAPAPLQPDPVINQAGRGSAAAVIAGTKARSTGTAARPGLSGVFVQRF
jgi:glycosyltransferase involved in cell wall biosynthesis